MAAANKAELEAFEAALQQFRVNELHILLSSFKCPKLGKKTELVQRCINLLQNARNQAAVIQKIREISSSRRYNTLGASSSAPMYNHIDGSGGMNGSVYHPVMALSSAFMQQQYISAHNPFSSQMDRAKSLRIVDLPFFDKQMTLLDLTELPGNISGIRATSRLAFTFSVPSEVIPRIIYRSESAPLPRIELQLRFFLLDHSVEQHDDFPPNCSVKIDDVPVTLPNVIPTNKPNAEPKRPSRPVNITPYCQPPRDAMRPHRIVVEWTADKRAWAMGVYVVNRLTSDILLRRLLMNVNARRDAEETKRLIKNRLSGDDDAIQMETLRISLLCPLGKTRMKIPVKACDCSHLQCFDLSNFLLMNEKRPTWKCAVCDNGAAYKRLIVDGYFEKMLKETDSDTTEVELLHDGSWRSVAEEVETVSDDDEEIGSSNDSKQHLNGTRNGAHSNRPISDADDIIVLDSDDDDEVPRTRQAPNRISKSQASSIPVVCIDLDESDPVDLSPQTSQMSRAPCVQPTSSESIISRAPSTSSALPATIRGTAHQVGSTHPMMQHQPPHPAQTVPYFPGSPVPLVPPPNTGMPGTSAANFFNPFEQTPYPSYYQQEFNTRLIAEELRQFMANIQHSTSPPAFPRYS